MKDLHWSLNLKVVSYLKNRVFESSKVNIMVEMITLNSQTMSAPDTHTKYTKNVSVQMTKRMSILYTNLE